MHTNIIKSIKAVGNEIALKKGDRDLHSMYMHDESKITSNALSSISFPTSIEEVSSELSYCYQNDIPIRVSGARTGLAAGAVPKDGEHLISLTKLNKIIALNNEGNLHVQAGVSLAEVNSFLDENHPELFFPVDPTETSASVAGGVATNAGGARSFKYGSMRTWVEALSIVLPCGDILKLKRGQYQAKDFKFEIKDSHSARTLEATKIDKPKTKNTLGYSYGQEIDLIDVFIGSEGTLGVLVEVELKLIKRPVNRLFLLQFFTNSSLALEFVKESREDARLDCMSIEFCDRRSIDFVKTSSIFKTNKAAQLLKDSHQAGVYLEIDLKEQEDITDCYEVLTELLGDTSMEDSIAGTHEKDLREIKAFRHAIPETINQTIAVRKQEFPELHKIGTDMAVPDDALEEIFELYNKVLSAVGLDYAIFGHAGNNHFHVNIIPKNLEELKKAKKIYFEIAREVVSLKGAVSAEHGIGSLKKEFLALQYSEDVFRELRKIKAFFDPKGLINNGIFFN